MRVAAADGFEAVIPWEQLDRAVFLYEQNGNPLKKGYPIRLYVPDGTSQCLNVKGVVDIFFLKDAGLGKEASFGFKNNVSIQNMKWGLAHD